MYRYPQQIIDARYGSQQACHVDFCHYGSGRLALQLTCAAAPTNPDSFEEPWATASVNLGSDLAPYHLAMKDWSENSELPTLLAQQGIIEARPVAHIPSGHVVAPVHRLSQEVIEWLKSQGVHDAPDA